MRNTCITTDRKDQSFHIHRAAFCQPERNLAFHIPNRERMSILFQQHFIFTHFTGR